VDKIRLFTELTPILDREIAMKWFTCSVFLALAATLMLGVFPAEAGKVKVVFDPGCFKDCIKNVHGTGTLSKMKHQMCMLRCSTPQGGQGGKDPGGTETDQIPVVVVIKPGSKKPSPGVNLATEGGGQGWTRACPACWDSCSQIGYDCQVKCNNEPCREACMQELESCLLGCN
jgi:hypothetical protein